MGRLHWPDDLPVSKVFHIHSVQMRVVKWSFSSNDTR